MTERFLLKPGEAAEALGVSRSRAYELIASGVIPSVRLGSTLRVPAEGLRAKVAKMATSAGNMGTEG